MKLLIKERASGKTTGLIYASEGTGFPICVTVRSRIEYILQLAEELGCNIPQPITVEELKLRGRRVPENILYDEVGEILGKALGTHVVYGVMTDYEKENKKREQRIKNYNGNIGKDLIGRKIKADTRFKVINIEPHNNAKYVCIQEYLGKTGKFNGSFEFSDTGFHSAGHFDKEYINAIDAENGELCWRYDEVEILD